MDSKYLFFNFMSTEMNTPFALKTELFDLITLIIMILA